MFSNALAVPLLLLVLFHVDSRPVCDCRVPSPHEYDCRGCSDIPASVVRKATVLYLSGNITRFQLPDDVVAPTKQLFLNRNRISVVSKEDFCRLEQLWLLDLSSNNLTDLQPDSFECNRHLNRLVISGNPGLNLPALKSDSIRDVYLEHGKITNLYAEQFRGLKNLAALYLYDNPGLDCMKVKQQFQSSMPDVTVFCDETCLVQSSSSAENSSSQAGSSVGDSSNNSSLLPEEDLQVKPVESAPSSDARSMVSSGTSTRTSPPAVDESVRAISSDTGSKNSVAESAQENPQSDLSSIIPISIGVAAPLCVVVTVACCEILYRNMNRRNERSRKLEGNGEEKTPLRTQPSTDQNPI